MFFRWTTPLFRWLWSLSISWLARRDSNPRLSVQKTAALPAKLRTRSIFFLARETGLEPATFGFGSRRSTIELLPSFNLIIFVFISGNTGIEPYPLVFQTSALTLWAILPEEYWISSTEWRISNLMLSPSLFFVFLFNIHLSWRVDSNHHFPSYQNGALTLSYIRFLGVWPDSNRHLPEPQTGALPIKLQTPWEYRILIEEHRIFDIHWLRRQDSNPHLLITKQLHYQLCNPGNYSAFLRYSIFFIQCSLFFCGLDRARTCNLRLNRAPLFHWATKPVEYWISIMDWRTAEVICIHFVIRHSIFFNRYSWVGNRDRTDIAWVEVRHSTIELHPHGNIDYRIQMEEPQKFEIGIACAHFVIRQSLFVNQYSSGAGGNRTHHTLVANRHRQALGHATPVENRIMNVGLKIWEGNSFYVYFFIRHYMVNVLHSTCGTDGTRTHISPIDSRVGNLCRHSTRLMLKQLKKLRIKN